MPGAYSPDAASAGKRALRLVTLSYLSRLDGGAAARAAYAAADNMTESFGSLAILLDIGAGAAELADFAAKWQGDRLVLDMAVVVGRPGRATPILATRLTTVQFNPPWGVPVRNAVEDKLPQLQRNPLALQRAGIRIFQRVDGEVTEVDPTQVNWRGYSRTNFPFVLRQDPGELNALGRIRPSPEEVRRNPRSRSAIMRVAERTGVDA